MTENLKVAYTLITQLKLDSAQIKINSIKSDEPNNMLVYHIENYIDFFRIFISEDKDELDLLLPNKKTRMTALKKGNASSPYHRFTQAEVYLQWVLARSKFYKGKGIPDLSLVSDLNKAYRLLEENAKLFPSFTDNYKSLSILHALASYLPGVVQNVFNIEGSLQKGLDEIRFVIDEHDDTDYVFLKEAKVIEAYMLLHLFNKPKEAWEAIQSAGLDPAKSPLDCFIISSIADKLGFNHIALEALEKKPVSENHEVFHYLSYLEGKILLQQMDIIGSKERLHQYVDHFKGRHFIKDAYQKLAWGELFLNNHIAGYYSYMKLVESEGEAILEDDQQALFEAKQSRVPNTILLHARLFFDAGFYEEALEVVASLSSQSDDSLHAMEYHYRNGRILQKLDRKQEAIDSFKNCIAIDSDKSTFFSCNAALQTGLLYEIKKEYQRAGFYFGLCRQINADRYRDQLHKKAKAGLERIRTKVKS